MDRTNQPGQLSHVRASAFVASLGAVLYLLAGTVQAWAGEALTLGIFAYRPKAVLEQRYQPLADYLGQQLGTTQVRLQVLTQEEMEKALARKSLDLLFTNPSHYILLRSRNNLTGALATLVSKESGRSTSYLGGVVIARADAPVGQGLEQLRGHRVVVPGTKFLGGYQTQAYELLQLGIKLPEDATLDVRGSHDEVVAAVLAGEARFGFIRTGVIEEMTQEGKLDPTQVQVLNQQRPPDFPYLLSTRLYPEWAFVALPHVDSRQVRKIASSLMGLEEDHPVARAAGIGGFAPPGDYLPVENLARALRMPPFDQTPAISLKDVWMNWQAIWITLIAGFTTALLLLVMRLLGHNRALLHLQKEQQRAETAVRESEQHYRTLANSGSALIWTSGSDKRCDYFNGPWLRFTGRVLAQELGDGWTHGVHPEDLARCMTVYHNAFDQREPFDMEYRLRHADGSYRWIRDEGRPRYDSSGHFIGYIGHCYDITTRREAEHQLQLAASVFTSAREGILITDPQGVIMDVNQAFTDITGYRHDEVVGRNASLLKSGRQGSAFYVEFWRALCSSGHWSGEIWNRRKDGAFFAENLTVSAVADKSGQTRHYVGLFSDITPQKEQQRQLERLAHYDALTGLPNRVLLADRLHQAMAQTKRRGARLAVALIDLDGFKEVNDRHGHKAGDDLLMAIAERMRASLRDGDTVARIGGDEFVAVLADLEANHDCLPMIQRLLEATARPLKVAEHLLQVSGSIGFTFFPQAEEIEAEQLLRQADQAMYQAKVAGKNRYHGFDAELDRNVRSRHESLEDIRRGLREGEFLLHYQPKVNMRSGQVIGVEALIRWRHPERGLLYPAAFLFSIEKHPLDIELGHWVLATALAQGDAWRSAGLHLSVSVNISGLHLQQPEFVARLQELLAAYPDFVPGSLVLEVLETNALEDIRHVSQVMADCAEMGVGFALDDFGTGYSSLTYLKHLPVAELKIDQSFVRDMLHDPEDLAILQGVQGLAQAFRRRVIAEGVETETHGARLVQLGCDLGQGYGIARPMPAAEIADWMAHWQPPARWQGARRLAAATLPLLYAAIEHRAWLKAFDAYLAGERAGPPTLDPGQCRFGQWLEGLRHERMEARMVESLAQIETLHQAIHQVAERILAAHEQKQAGAARQPELLQLSQQLQAALDQLLELA